MTDLTTLAAQITDGTIEVIDLTSPLQADTPILQLPPEFGQTAPFRLEEISRYDDRGPAWYWNNISTGEHTGTHLDAPNHWVTGQDKGDVASIPPKNLIGPAVVIDRVSEVAANPDYLLDVPDIQGWESEHGKLPDRGWLLFRTGWSSRGDDPARFANADEQGSHTPGVSPAAAAYLATTNLLGFGVETVGTDAGQAPGLTPAFPCHQEVLGAGKYGLTQLRNLDRLPVTGAVVIAAPLPIVTGSGSPARVLALVDTSTVDKPGVTGTVAQAIGAALAAGGVTTVFGVAGSGNFHVTNALIGAGARFVPARHEGGAVVMADAYARITGRLGVLSVHQGPGLTNAMTGITEAAKSRTPLLILAAEATSPLSNFHIDQPALARAVGARSVRVGSAATAAADTARAVSLAASGHTVLLNLPLTVQGETVSGGAFGSMESPAARPAAPDPESVAALADALAAADRPVFIAGRGARRAGHDLQALAERPGALLATSAVSRGLFRGHPWNLDVSGGFATPAAARLITGADLIVGWGCALNMWTLRHGTLVGPDATVVAVDTDAGALGAHQHADLGVVGDAGATARAALAELERRGGPPGPGYRTPEAAALLSEQGRWRDVPYQPAAEPGRIDPRTLTIALDDLLPGERTVVVDSGNFMGYPSMFLDVPDADGFVFTQAYQSVGLGLAGAVGAAVARPDRLTVAACGDGGLLMGASELETVVRLGLDLTVVAYDDEAYGAEVHHFGPGGEPLDIVRFPPADLAAIGRGFGFEAVTVRSESDLPSVGDWARGPRNRPLLIDAKVTQGAPSWWLEEAFRGH